MNELKKCPFCGGEAYSVHDYVCCDDVSCGGFAVDVPVESWNRRPIEEALESELAPFRDPYFNGLDTATIAELAKKSIRLTTAHCQDRDRIAELEEIVARQAARVVELEEQKLESDFIMEQFEDWWSEECPEPCPFRESRIAGELENGDSETREEAEQWIDAETHDKCGLCKLEGRCWIEHYRNLYRQSKEAAK